MTTERPTIYRIIHLWPNKLPVDQRDSCTVQIKAEDGNGSLPSQLVSLQDYEKLERESNLRLAHAGHRAELAEGKAERAEAAFLREFARAEFAEGERDEALEQLEQANHEKHMNAVKILSRESLIEQLSETQLAKDVGVMEGALREIAEDNEHPSWRKAKAIAREALKSESQDRAR